MDLLEGKISSLVEPVAQELGYELVRVRVFGGRVKTVQIMAERGDGGMQVEDCAILSRALSPVFDAADPVSGEWVLEVSSPGIDRPLTRAKDFAAYSGHEAKIELRRPVDGRKRFKGLLVGLEGNDVLFRQEGETETRRLPRADIDTAKLVLTDELLKTGGAPAMEN